MDKETSVMRITLFASLAVVGLLTLSGCYTPEPRPQIIGEDPSGALLPAQTSPPRYRVAGRSVEGRPIMVQILGHGPDTTLIMGTRENVHGIDLNRNFRASNRLNNETNGLKPLSEPESRAIEAVIRQYHPDRIVSIHQPLNCIDYDGPAQALAARMAQYCDLRVKKLGARPGSLGSYTGEELRIPTITVELPTSRWNCPRARRAWTPPCCGSATAEP